MASSSSSSPASSPPSSPASSSSDLPFLPTSHYDGLFSPEATDREVIDLTLDDDDEDAFVALMAPLPDPSVPSVPAMHYNNCYFAFLSTFRLDVRAAIPGAERRQKRIVREARRRWKLCDTRTKDLWRQIVKASHVLFSPNPNSRKAGKPRPHRKAPGSSIHHKSRKKLSSSSLKKRGTRSRKAGARSNRASTPPPDSFYPGRAWSDSPPPLIPPSPNSLPPLLPPSSLFVPANLPINPPPAYMSYRVNAPYGVAVQPPAYPSYVYGADAYSSHAPPAVAAGFYDASAYVYGPTGVYLHPSCFPNEYEVPYHDTYPAPSASVDSGIAAYGASAPFHMPNMQGSLEALPSQAFSDSPSPPTAPQVSLQSELEAAESIFDSLDTEVLNALWVQLQDCQT